MSAVRRLADALRAAADPGRARPATRRPTDRTAAGLRAAATTGTFHRPSRPERATVRSTDMYPVHEQLARQTWHEASTEARRAERSAAQALEVARRATERIVLA